MLLSWRVEAGRGFLLLIYRPQSPSLWLKCAFRQWALKIHYLQHVQWPRWYALLIQRFVIGGCSVDTFRTYWWTSQFSSLCLKWAAATRTSSSSCCCCRRSVVVLLVSPIYTSSLRNQPSCDNWGCQERLLSDWCGKVNMILMSNQPVISLMFILYSPYAVLQAAFFLSPVRISSYC